MPIIQYIGRREYHRDVLYGTGEWTIGQKKEVSGITASKMLKHPDVYLESAIISDGKQQPDGRKLFSMAAWPSIKTIDVINDQKGEKNQDDTSDQDARDAVMAMSSKESIAEFAAINYNQSIPRTLSLDNMRQRAITLIDQYGI